MSDTPRVDNLRASLPPTKTFELAALRAAKMGLLAEDLERENRELRKELENIASVSMEKWEMDGDEFLSEFQAWAQNRARHAIAKATKKNEN